MHWRRKWQPTPIFLPGESHGWRSLVGCHLWGHTVGHNWSDLAAAASLIKALKLVSWICWVRSDSHMNNDCCTKCGFFCLFVVISQTTKGTASLRTLKILILPNETFTAGLSPSGIKWKWLRLGYTQSLWTVLLNVLSYFEPWWLWDLGKIVCSLTVERNIPIQQKTGKKRRGGGKHSNA